MKHLSIIRCTGYLCIVMLNANCKKEINVTDPSGHAAVSSLTPAANNLIEVAGSQTRTATLLNYNLEGNLVTNYSRDSKASNFAFDDGVYASTKKMTPRNGYSLLVLEGFGFNIPADATIQNIIVKARRFKTGTCEIKEVNASLVIKRERTDLPDWWEQYGARWADPNNFPTTETAINYSQTGNGTTNNGQLYQWTPARINDLYFGVLFQTTSGANSKGSAVIFYDLVEITVEYF